MINEEITQNGYETCWHPSQLQKDYYQKYNMF